MADLEAHAAVARSNSPSLAELHKIWLDIFRRSNDSEGPNGYYRNVLVTPQAFTNNEGLDICERLLHIAIDSKAYLEDLSETISDVLSSKFLHGENINATTACTRAMDLLDRLPQTSSALSVASLNNIEAATIRNYCWEHDSRSRSH
jgi:hypothetical protein